MNSIDVIITVHVEEHAKFYKDYHLGHTNFFKMILNDTSNIPFTLLISRVKEEPSCPGCDKTIFNELRQKTNVEIGLHVHPAVAAYEYSTQKKIITNEYNRLLKETDIIPKTFSGGHWCINNNSIKIIRELGLLVDASVVPGRVVTSHNGVVVKHGNKHKFPYWISKNNLWDSCKIGDVLEMPVSVNQKGELLDLFLMPLWDIKKYLIFLSKNYETKTYLHMTMHSYDVLFSDGSKNYIYDKILYLCETIQKYFDKVNFYTCHDYLNKFRRTHENYH